MLLSRNPVMCAMLLFLFSTGLVLELSAQKVKIDYEKKTDFSRFKTYAWVQGTPVIDPEMDFYITNRVTEVLRRSGMTEASISAADLIVTYHAARNTDLVVGTALDPTFAASGGVPLPGHGMWDAAGSSPQHITKGSLEVEMLDRAANRPVWSGTAKHSLSDKPADRWKDVQKALDKLLRGYPPR